MIEIGLNEITINLSALLTFFCFLPMANDEAREKVRFELKRARKGLKSSAFFFVSVPQEKEIFWWKLLFVFLSPLRPVLWLEAFMRKMQSDKVKHTKKGWKKVNSS